ncbi:cytoskeleton protein RodZ [Vibrio algarum]|uniref:Cytoskeleton protein RodZ n=1 Tax=Vibrio algarum TaxID=3020714 RepID=A0ABT4YUP6_9VIBR|nr:cytoskeleton protein RodZ [Vibrio sp. KJ40-1]MDB1124738.1 cytoskeleton protein RodZ [Vibrio sp. KJ40-1]
MTTEIETIVTEEVVETTAAVQAGDMLRAKREELGISQEEIADRLRLRLSIIQSIDENNYDFDQVATFTRGYLRSYAKAVSLDEKMVLASLDGFKEAQHSEQKMQSFSRKTKREKHDRRIMKLTWVIGLVIVGISSVWWYQNQQDTLTQVSDVEMASPVIEVEPVQSNEPASPDRSQFEQPAVEVIPEMIEENQSELVEPTPEVTSNSEPQQAIPEVETEIVITEDTSEPLEQNSHELTMSFSADCWVQVKDDTGKTFATGVKKAGSSLKFNGKAPYKIILGAPEGVSMTFANEPVDLSGYNTGKVARFTLP